MPTPPCFLIRATRDVLHRLEVLQSVRVENRRLKRLRCRRRSTIGIIVIGTSIVTSISITTTIISMRVSIIMVVAMVIMGTVVTMAITTTKLI